MDRPINLFYATCWEIFLSTLVQPVGTQTIDFQNRVSKFEFKNAIFQILYGISRTLNSKPTNGVIKYVVSLIDWKERKVKQDLNKKNNLKRIIFLCAKCLTNKFPRETGQMRRKYASRKRQRKILSWQSEHNWIRRLRGHKSCSSEPPYDPHNSLWLIIFSGKPM